MARRRFIPIVTFSTLMVALGGCSPGREQPPTEIPVFVISIDTLRADRVGAWTTGSSSLTPAIDELARQSLRFQHAFSPCPLTLPSHASLLTGLLPSVHGVRDNLGYALDKTRPTLARLLREHGYATGAAVSSTVLRFDTGLHDGFDVYDDSMGPPTAAGVFPEERSGQTAATLLEGWLDRLSTRRVFGFLHVYEPHAPYEAPTEFSRGREPYDAEVALADSIVGSFLEALKRRGLYESALIVLVSDHGEGLGDHGEEEHGIFLYRESIHVPLLIKLPNGERGGEVITDPVSLIDVVPTVLGVLKIPEPQSLSGRNLLGKPGLRPVLSESWFPGIHLGWSELTSLIDSRHHYIQAPASELYRYREDPEERRNLVSSERREAAAMRQELATLRTPFSFPDAVTDEDRKRLAALGYLGAVSTDGKILPDPKERIGSIRILKSAMASFQSKRFQQTEEILRPLLSSVPELVDGWALLAESHRRQGQREQALNDLRQGLEKLPSCAQLMLLAADVLIELKRYDEAAREASRVLTIDESSAREKLARVAIARNNPAEAQRELSLALAGAPERTGLLMLMADTLMDQRRYAEALPYLDRALDIQMRRRTPTPLRLHLWRGRTLLEMRRVAEAETAFRRQTETVPADLEGWGALAAVLWAQERHQEAGQTLAEAVKRNPGPSSVRFANETRRALESTLATRP